MKVQANDLIVSLPTIQAASRLFAQLTRRFTLFAFAVHAVLGCCWHHTHAHSAPKETGSVAVSTNGSDDNVRIHSSLARSAQSHSIRTCCHHSSTGGEAKMRAAVHAQAASQSLDAEGHSGSCDETRCHFLSAESKTELMLGIPPAFVTRLEEETRSTAETTFGPSSHPTSLPKFSAASRCALYQSWQI